jgi:hypothetical protein
MQQIISITSDAWQTFQAQVTQNESASITLKYAPSQYSWYMDIVSNSLTVYGMKVVLHPNILRQWRNNIEWGIAFTALGDLEPCSIDDFANQRVNMYLLDSSEVQQIETEIYGG